MSADMAFLVVYTVLAVIGAGIVLYRLGHPKE